MAILCVKLVYPLKLLLPDISRDLESNDDDVVVLSRVVSDREIVVLLPFEEPVLSELEMDRVVSLSENNPSKAYDS